MAARAGFEEGEDRELTPQEAAKLRAAMEALEADVAKEEPALEVQAVSLRHPGWQRWLRVSHDEHGIPVRHRVASGGRGAAKSWTFARTLLERGTKRVERILCTREFQRSIRDSVHRLLVDEINRMGLGVLGSGFYFATDKEIRGANGTLFVFAGLHRNENGIKSLEGITIAWVEEAQAVSQSSIDALTPTIRAEGSEIWWSYNPKSPKDPVDKMFRGKEGPPPGTILLHLTYVDNPWFPEPLRLEMEHAQRRDPDKYAHIWLGEYLQHSEAKVFRNWRIMRFDVPEGAVLRHGADWGFATDPTVLVQCFIGRWSGKPWDSDPIADPLGMVLFVSAEAYSIGCPVDELPSLFAGSDEGQIPGKERWKNPHERPGVPGAHRWQILADSARPELIAYLRARGFNIEAAKKGPGSVEEGVTFLQSYDICVHPDCTHVADELLLYSYKTDEKTGEIFPVLADKDNHTIDSLRYALEAVRRAGSGKMTVASTGQRATLRADDRRLEQETMAKISSPSASAPAQGGGAGWGSAPGIRTGIL